MKKSVWVAVFSAAFAGCQEMEESVCEIEAMASVSCETPTPRECAQISGEARVWDFTKGVPSGGALRKGARIEAGGLFAVSPTNMSLASGFALDKHFTPSGAFLFEATFVTGKRLGGIGQPVCDALLWDDLAITYAPKHTHRGFQLALSGREGRWTPVLWAGFSNSTVNVRGPQVELAPGAPATLSFFFGANGRVVWEFNGKKLETTLACAGPLAPSVRYKPIIGDRAVSNFHPMDGMVQRVAITPCASERLSLFIDGRQAFRRGETGATVAVRVQNVTDVAVSGLTLEAEEFVEAGRAHHETLALGALAGGATTGCVCQVETRVRPGWQAFRVTVSGKDATGGEVKTSRVFRLGIGPKADDRMMALMWGYSASEATLAEYGFTHGLKYQKPGDARAGVLYDQAVVAGVGLFHSMSTEYPGGEPDPKYVRVNRDGSQPTHGGWGSKKKPVPEVSNPAFMEAMKPLIAEDGRLYGKYPGFSGVLAISEARDATKPSFNTEHLRYKKATGRDVPREVSGKVMDYRKGLAEMRKRFPDGVVPTDDPVLAYYRWFWKGGDGWPGYSGGIAQEYHRQISRPDFLVFWDPAVRCPPIWGSGGAVDVLNQWVYAVPEPMNVAGPAEEILAMAAGRPGQRPAIMTQLICYRSQIAPTNKTVSPEPVWVKRRPRADFPTIPPDTLQEATWSMIAKPVQAIMYHGWGTIYETGAATGYTYTNPASKERIKHLLKDVVAPLGPTLKRLGRATPAVAVLESFTTCALGGPASWGWKVPAVTFLQRARLDPRVVYEETILRDGLGDVKVLYAPQCLFLTPEVVAKIKAFQAAGGTLVADNQLLTALKADIEVPVVSFSPPPESDHTADVDAMEAAREGDAKTRKGTYLAKAKMNAQAEELRQKLAARYVPEADSSSPEIVVYSRRWNGVRYVFAINDHRTFGDYVGLWGLTMEKGLPFAGEVTLADDGTTKAVYELSRGGAVAFTRQNGRIRVPVSYETNDGRLFAFLGERIASVTVEAPKRVRRGEAVRVTFSARNAAGKPVNALLPAEIRLFDASGCELDGAGWVSLQGGVCTVEIATNLDDPRGDYRLVCRDRASGLTAERTITQR